MYSRKISLAIATACGLLGTLSLGFCPVAHATQSVDQHQAADPAGVVEITNVAGSIKVSGWDKPEVAVTGRTGDRVERVEVTSSDHRTTVRVILPHNGGSHDKSDDGEADLTIHVPKGSSLQVSLVSADLTVTGVTGAQQLRTVSGNIASDAGGAAHVNSVSGNIQLTVPNNTPAQVESISGDVSVNGAGGDVAINTMNGNGHLTLGSLHNFNLHTVSGDFDVHAGLDSGGQFATESVSGDVKVQLSGSPGAEFDLQSLSGEISNCTGQKPTHPQYGPGSHLNFSTGDGHAHVRMSSTSGALGLCAR